MLSLLLLKFAIFTLWTTLLTGLLTVLQTAARRRSPKLILWPALYWYLLLLSSVPLWPQWQWPVTIQLPDTLWLDATTQVNHLTATAQHPALIETSPLERLWQILGAVLLLGTAWQLLRLARQYQQVLALYRRARPVDPKALFASDQALPAIDPRLAMLNIRQHQLALSPFIFGARRPVLMLPAYFWQFRNPQRALLLAHELQHWQRRDPWQLLIWRLILAIAWFNPALRYFEQGFGRAMELTVDRQVLAAQPQQALLYGQTLIGSLKLCRQQAGPGFASFTQSRDDAGYRYRLAALFQATELSSRLRLWLPVAMLSLALVLSLGCSALQGQAPKAGQWRLPVAQAKVNSAFGTVSPLRQNRPHQGIDFAGSTGDPVFASQDALVLIADNHSLNPNYGNSLLLDHGHGFQTLYAHLDAFSVQAGTWVRKGEQIGTLGASGFATGPHLHFELLQKGQTLDPTAHLQWAP